MNKIEIFSDESLISLPNWINASEVNFSIESIPEIEKPIEKIFSNADLYGGG